MLNTQSLRTKILDLAMRGQLTEQLPTDGTAEDLYQRIQAEKQAMIKAGKIKKEKPLPPIGEDEIPFEVPKGWKWCRLGEIIKLQSGQDLKPEEYNANHIGIPYLTGASNYNDDGTFFINRWTDAPRSLANKNDILLSCKGTVGKLGILTLDVVHIARQIMGIHVYEANIKYIKYFLFSMIELIKQASKGLIPGIERNDVLLMPIPLPPLAEQQRIVSRIEAAFAELDVIDKLQAAYHKNREVLRKKLIDAAIRGELTQRLPGDGDAEDLYQKIQAEKQAMIKAGKNKKEKPLPPIGEDEIPFEVPKGWRWVRFGSLYSLSNGTASRGSKEGTEHPVLRLADLSNNEINTDDIRLIKLTDKEFLSHQLVYDDLVFIRVNGSKDRVATAFHYTSSNVISYCDHLFCGRKTSKYVYEAYVRFAFNCASTREQLLPEIKTTAGQNTISQTSMVKILIPLPPLAEQQRIVVRLGELLGALG